MAVLFNIDAIDAFRRLSSEPPLREAIVAQATPIAGGAAPVLNVARAEEELKKLGLGVGWPCRLREPALEQRCV